MSRFKLTIATCMTTIFKNREEDRSVGQVKRDILIYNR